MLASGKPEFLFRGTGDSSAWRDTNARRDVRYTVSANGVTYSRPFTSKIKQGTVVAINGSSTYNTILEVYLNGTLVAKNNSTPSSSDYEYVSYSFVATSDVTINMRVYRGYRAEITMR